MSRWAEKVDPQLLREIVSRACDEGVRPQYLARALGYDHSYLGRLAKDMGKRFKRSPEPSPELSKMLLDAAGQQSLQTLLQLGVYSQRRK